MSTAIYKVHNTNNKIGGQHTYYGEGCLPMGVGYYLIFRTNRIMIEIDCLVNCQPHVTNVPLLQNFILQTIQMYGLLNSKMELGRVTFCDKVNKGYTSTMLIAVRKSSSAAQDVSSYSGIVSNTMNTYFIYQL